MRSAMQFSSHSISLGCFSHSYNSNVFKWYDVTGFPGRSRWRSRSVFNMLKQRRRPAPTKQFQYSNKFCISMMIGLKFNINDGECSTKSYFNLKVILFSLSKFSYIVVLSIICHKFNWNSFIVNLMESYDLNLKNLDKKWEISQFLTGGWYFVKMAL